MKRQLNKINKKTEELKRKLVVVNVHKDKVIWVYKQDCICICIIFVLYLYLYLF